MTPGKYRHPNGREFVVLSSSPPIVRVLWVGLQHQDVLESDLEGSERVQTAVHSWFTLYEDDEDARRMANGHLFEMLWDWRHGWPKVIQTTEHGASETERRIVTYERREEWLNGRPYRSYYVRC